MKIQNIHCENCHNSTCLIKTITQPEIIDLVVENKRILHFTKGQIIINEGVPFDDVAFIYKGKIAVYKQGYQSKRQIIRLSKSGEMIGHRGFKKELMPISAITLDHSDICFIPKNIFLEILNQDINFSNHLLMFYADELHDSEVLTRNHSHMSVRELIADSLIRMHKAFGFKKQTKALDVVVSRQNLAEIAGTTKEQISKYLYEFQSEGILTIKNKEILIESLSKLEEITKNFSNN